MAQVLTLAGLDDQGLQNAVEALEHDGLVVFSDLPFELHPGEERFLTTDIFSGGSKNVSFDPDTGKVSGTRLEGSELDNMAL